MQPPLDDHVAPEEADGPLDGPVSDQKAMTESNSAHSPEKASVHRETFCSDRAELIERLKRGESPNWLPNQSVSFLFDLPLPFSGESGREGHRKRFDGEYGL